MAGFLVAAAEAVRGLQCQLLAANEYVAGAVGTLNPVTRVTAPIAINGLRRLLGCNEAEDYENPGPPFTGGQCACSLYRRVVTLTGNNPTTGVPFTTTSDRRARGPIGPLTFPQPGEARTSDRGSASFSSGNTPACQATQQFGSLIFPAGATNFQSSMIVTLLSGPDNCGDPPNEDFPPTTNITNNTNVTYNTDEGNEVTVNIPFVFAPIKVNFDGSLRIPFTFDFGGLEFSGDINLGSNNDVTINPPALPTGEGQGTDTLPPGDPGDEVPPAPPDEKIIGVVVNSAIAGEQQLTTIAQQGMPSILAPRAGSIKFAYSLGGATFWSSDIDVKTERTFIPCPFSQGADAVVVSPAPGIALTWVPIRGFPLATVKDVQSS